MVLEEEREMKSILERLERYLDRKGLELNVGKTKVLKFREEGRRMSRLS